MNIGQVVVGIILVLIATGGLLYIFYSRSNAVEKTGSGTLVMLAIISLMIPMFWILEGGGQATATTHQFATSVQRGMMLYAKYCNTACYSIHGDKLVNPTYNGYTIDALNQMSDDQLRRVIAAGAYNPAVPAPANPSALIASDQYGGQLQTNDVEYLFNFIRSANPAYLDKNGYTGQRNGFSQLVAYLQNNVPSAYSTAVALGSVGQFGKPVDMTKSSAITIVILDTAPGQTCSPSCFQYLNLAVKVGTVITWVNKTAQPHTVTALSGNGSDTTKHAPQIFDSTITKLINDGQSFTYTVTQDAYTFNSDHTVVYYCQVHPMMLAELTVVP